MFDFSDHFVEPVNHSSTHQLLKLSLLNRSKSCGSLTSFSTTSSTSTATFYSTTCDSCNQSCTSSCNPSCNQSCNQSWETSLVVQAQAQAQEEYQLQAESKIVVSFFFTDKITKATRIH